LHFKKTSVSRTAFDMRALRADMIMPLCEFSRQGQNLLAHRTPEKRVVVAEESQAQAGPGEKMRLSGRMFQC